MESNLGHHISKRFNEDLEHVRNSVLAMGGLVEEQLDRAIRHCPRPTASSGSSGRGRHRGQSHGSQHRRGMQPMILATRARPRATSNS
jgi:hypothetical protein